MTSFLRVGDKLSLELETLTCLSTVSGERRISPHLKSARVGDRRLGDFSSKFSQSFFRGDPLSARGELRPSQLNS